jgi:MFS transporter, DHA3 family, macrolide efflux protein
VEQPTKLFNRNYLLLWQGQVLSRLGNQAFAIALLFWIKDTIGSATFMGLALALASLPALLLEPIGGAVADRYSRRRIIILGDLFSGLAVLSLAGLMYLAPSATGATLTWLIVVSTFLATVNAFFLPAIAASIPDLVPAERLSGANSMGQLSMQLSLFIGQGLGATLFRLLGAPIMLMIDGLSFLYAAASASFVKLPQRAVARDLRWQDQIATFKSDLAEGLRYVWSNTGLKALVLIAALSNFFTAPILLLLPFYIENYLKASKDWYGFFQAAFGVGSLLGFVLVGVLRVSGVARTRLILLTLLLHAAGYGLLVLAWSPIVAVGFAVLLGCTGGIVTVQIMTLVQLTTPPELRGRVLGLLGTIEGSMTPIALGLAGVIADLTGQNVPLIYLSCSGAMLVLVLVIGLNRETRAFFAYRPPAAIDQPAQPSETPDASGQAVPLN